MKILLFGLLLCSLSSATCVLVNTSPRMDAVTISCNDWPSGVTRTYREFSVKEWARLANMDTIPADTTKR